MKRIAVLLTAFAATAAQASHELDDRDIENGKVLYSENCASCHGVDLEGQPNWRSPDENGVLPAPPHDETGHTWHHDNGLLFQYTKLGGKDALEQRGVTGFKSGMLGFDQALTDEEIWEVLAYIRSTWPERIQENHLMRNPPHN